MSNCARCNRYNHDAGACDGCRVPYVTSMACEADVKRMVAGATVRGGTKTTTCGWCARTLAIKSARLAVDRNKTMVRTCNLVCFARLMLKVAHDATDLTCAEELTDRDSDADEVRSTSVAATTIKRARTPDCNDDNDSTTPGMLMLQLPPMKRARTTEELLDTGFDFFACDAPCLQSHY